MKAIILMTAMLLALSSGSFAQSIEPDKIVGQWMTEEKELKIEIFKSGGSYSGKLLWSKDMFEADGKTPKKDSMNPDDKLKGRSLEGIVHITGLVFKDGEYNEGTLYRAQDGNKYSLKAVMKNNDKLETRGYSGIPMMGKTFKWDRVQ